VNDREIDDALNEAAGAPDELEPALLKRAADSIKSSLRPVRPLPSTPVLAGGLVLVCAAVSAAAAAASGFYGFEKMTMLDRALIFSTLGAVAWLAATEFASAMIPGSRRRISPGTLLGITCVALLGVFVFLFRDYRVEHFVSVGIVCLLTGLLYAIPAGLLSWLVLRRGFAINSVSAGLLAGTLAGLAGVGMLELHCPNFEAPHVLVWHTAVVPISAGLGALVGWALRFRQRDSAPDHAGVR
jgi:hypothetical protein